MLSILIVTILESNRIVVEARGTSDGASLLILGFSKKSDAYFIKLDNEKEQLSLLKKLTEIGAVFSYGHGWAPSQVMGYLKEQGKVNFSYKEIMWRSPDNYEIIDH